MGVAYSVHEIDPERTQSLVREFGKSSDLSAQRAQDLLRGFGKQQPSDLNLESWDELEELVDESGWSYLLCEGCSVRSWDLDKSLDRPHQGLPGLTDAVPDMAPLDRLLKAVQGFAVPGIPEEFRAPELGLVGIASPDVLRAAAPVARRYSGTNARSEIGSLNLPFLQRLFGGAAFLRELESRSEYLWTHWSQADGGNHRSGCAMTTGMGLELQTSRRVTGPHNNRMKLTAHRPDQGGPAPPAIIIHSCAAAYAERWTDDLEGGARCRNTVQAGR